MRRRQLASALAAVVVLAGAACGSDQGGQDGAAPTTAVPEGSELPPYDPAQQLPPTDVAAMRRIYEGALAPMGLRLTRAALVDRSDGGYEESPDGTHLALYVEPTGSYTPAQYVAGIWTLSALVTPDVFARWPGLESYDICQEPLPEDDDRPEPFPITQLDITRAASDRIDWLGGDLVTLVEASRFDREVKLIVARDLRNAPEYQAALTAAGIEVATSSTTLAPATNPGG